MRMSSLSTFSIPVTPHGLLGTPGDLELRKRMGMNGLNISNANLAGLMGDVDAGVTCDMLAMTLFLSVVSEGISE